MIYRATHAGKLHNNFGQKNQDYICAGQSEGRIVISLADGVSSCTEAKQGANIAGEAITHLLTKKGDLIMEYDIKQIADITIGHVLGELGRKAVADNKALEDYSSTVASVLYDEATGRILCFNLGDSIIIAMSDGCSRIVAKPCDSSEGCCVTTTEDARLAVTVRIMNSDLIDSLTIFSDGAWRNMFNNDLMKPEVAQMLRSGEYAKLEQYLIQQNCADDYSFVSLELRNRSLS